MSRERVELVRRIYERWSQGDFQAGTELYDPNILLVLRPEFPESGTYIGLKEIGRYMREDFLADFDSARIIGEEFIEAGDSVIVRVNQQATGPGSGAPVGMSYYQAWTFRGPTVIRIESIKTRAQAFEATGLRR